MRMDPEQLPAGLVPRQVAEDMLHILEDGRDLMGPGLRWDVDCIISKLRLILYMN